MKMVNLPVCDLRNIKTAEAAREIEEILNCALVIFPKEGDVDLLNALATIPQQNVASTVSLPAEADISLWNGTATISAGMLREDVETYYLINGIAIIEEIPVEKKGTLVANGVTLFHEANRKASGMKLNAINGVMAYADFDHVIVQENGFELDADFLKYAKPKTAVIVGDSIEIADDVTADMLAEKIAYLIAGDSIVCPKAAAGYVRANSTCGDGIELK